MFTHTKLHLLVPSEKFLHLSPFDFCEEEDKRDLCCKSFFYNFITMQIPFVLIYLVALPITASHRSLAPPHPLRSSKQLPVDLLGQGPSSPRRRGLISSSHHSNNLVLPIRFADHANRPLPTPADLGVVFNSREGDSRRETLAPTGSVRQVFHFNSYGQFEVVSTVLPWVNITKTELDASGGSYGMSSSLLDALYEALGSVDTSGLDLSDFDVDGDGRIDMITFLHSGFMAEWGGVDCFGREEADRIWSHKWQIPLDLQIDDPSVFPLKMDSYVIASAVWGKCGSTIARVGLLSHELCHFLGSGPTGLEDLYDTSQSQEGRGLGSYDLLSDTWGRDYTQLYPPMMSPWTKAYLGWLEPEVITANGNYTIQASALVPAAYRIDAGFQEGEYLLIENRQPIGFDSLLSDGGLAIYLVDEKAPWQERRGFPSQPGWPSNGNHYALALLQADGSYDLERGRNTGDAGDLWHSLSKQSVLGPGVQTGKDSATVYPNTNSYQNGIVTATGLIISDFSKSGETMTFRVSSPLLSDPFVRNEAMPRDDHVSDEPRDIHSADEVDEEEKSIGKEPLSGAFDGTSSEASIGTVPALALSSLIGALIFHI